MSQVYTKHYRKSLGYSNAGKTTDFLAAKDVKPMVDLDYLNRLVERLDAIVRVIDRTIHPSYRQTDLDRFLEDHIWYPKQTILENGLIPRLNNQGRRPEQVLFSWLRGYTFCEYFRPAFSAIFNTRIEAITQIGDDDFRSPETFKRTPTADLEVLVDGQHPVDIEVQSGFQGKKNDIKKHKVKQAWAVRRDTGKPTICVHINLFDGQAAFLRLDTIAEDDAHFVTRAEMEGQEVLEIAPDQFQWPLMQEAPSLAAMGISVR